MGFPSVCCEYVLLPLVNKEAASAYGRVNIARLEEIEREQAEPRRRHVAAEGDRDPRTLPVGHSLW